MSVKPDLENLEPNALYYIVVKHDDDCRYWITDDPNRCSCEPEYERHKVTEGNMKQITNMVIENEQEAQVLRSRNRN
jgi:hypothetical protein